MNDEHRVYLQHLSLQFKEESTRLGRSVASLPTPNAEVINRSLLQKRPLPQEVKEYRKIISGTILDLSWTSMHSGCLFYVSTIEFH